MSPEHRNPTSGQGAQPTDTQKQITLYISEENERVNGSVGSISSDGAVFYSQSPLTLPYQVTLQFGNGDAFECVVNQRSEGTEFVLRFTDALVFARSQIGKCIAQVREFRENQAPAQLYSHLQEAHFFGDEEILDMMEIYLRKIREFQKTCSERLLSS